MYFQRHYASLAASKHGSRSFDAVWGCVNVKQKTLVMEELKSQQGSVVATLCGRVIASKTKLDLFRQDREAWIQQVTQNKPSRGETGAQKKEKKR